MKQRDIKDNIVSLPHITYAHSTKADGNMSYKFGTEEEVNSNILEFLEPLGIIDLSTLVTMVPEHGDTIIEVDEDVLQKTEQTNRGYLISCDAFITQLTDIPLVVKPADCTISIVHGTSQDGKSLLALIHAGRKGLSLELPRKVVKKLIQDYSVQPESIRIAVPPFITGKNHFVSTFEEIVNPEIWAGFIEKRDDTYYLDTGSLLHHQLTFAGVNEENVEMSSIDTFDAAIHGETFSHRYYLMNVGVTSGRMIVMAQLHG